MALVQSPYQIQPAYNPLVFKTDSEDSVTTTCESAPNSVNGDSLTQESVPFYGETVRAFNVQDVVSSWFVNETTTQWGNWAFHDWLLKALYKSDLSTTSFLALNAVRQTAESLDLRESYKSPFLTNRKTVNSLLKIPKYKGYPFGVDVMDAGDFGGGGSTEKVLKRYGLIQGFVLNNVFGACSFGDYMYFAAGGTGGAKGVLRTSDGINFEQVLASSGTNWSLNGVTVCNGLLFVLTLDQTSSIPGRRQFFTSPDGVTFTQRYFDLPAASYGNKYVMDVDFDGTYYYMAVMADGGGVAVLDSSFNYVSNITNLGASFASQLFYSIRYMPETSKYFIMMCNNSSGYPNLYSTITDFRLDVNRTAGYGNVNRISTCRSQIRHLDENLFVFGYNGTTGVIARKDATPPLSGNNVGDLTPSGNVYTAEIATTASRYDRWDILDRQVYSAFEGQNNGTTIRISNPVPTALPTQATSVGRYRSVDTDALFSTGNTLIAHKGDMYYYGQTESGTTVMWTTADVAPSPSDFALKVEDEQGNADEFSPAAPVHIDIYGMCGSNFPVEEGTPETPVFDTVLNFPVGQEIEVSAFSENAGALNVRLNFNRNVTISLINNNAGITCASSSFTVSQLGVEEYRQVALTIPGNLSSNPRDCCTVKAEADDGTVATVTIKQKGAAHTLEVTKVLTTNIPAAGGTFSDAFVISSNRPCAITTNTPEILVTPSSIDNASGVQKDSSMAIWVANSTALVERNLTITVKTVD